jgi:hypothetical protein
MIHATPSVQLPCSTTSIAAGPGATFALRRGETVLRDVRATIGMLSLVAIAVLLVPTAVKDHRYNRCIDEQVRLRRSSNLQGQEGPGKFIYLKAVEHCEGR